MRKRRSMFLSALALLAVCSWGTVYAGTPLIVTAGAPVDSAGDATYDDVSTIAGADPVTATYNIVAGDTITFAAGATSVTVSGDAASTGEGIMNIAATGALVTDSANFLVDGFGVVNNSGTITNTGAFTVATGGALANAANATFMNAGSLDLAAGTYTGGGALLNYDAANSMAGVLDLDTSNTATYDAAIADLTAGLATETNVGTVNITGDLASALDLTYTSAPGADPIVPTDGTVNLVGQAYDGTAAVDVKIGAADLYVSLGMAAVWQGNDIEAGSFTIEATDNITGIDVNSLTANAGDVNVVVQATTDGDIDVAAGITAIAVRDTDGAIVSGGNVIMDAQDGDILIGTEGITADAEIDLAGYNITSTGDLVAGGDITLTAEDTAATPNLGDVDVEGNVIAGGELTITGDNAYLGKTLAEYEVSGVDGVTIDVDNVVEIDANVASKSGAVSIAGSDITIGTGVDANSAGDITANKGILVDSTGEIVIGGDISNIADGATEASGNIAIGTNQAGGQHIYIGDSGVDGFGEKGIFAEKGNITIGRDTTNTDEVIVRGGAEAQDGAVSIVGQSFESGDGTVGQEIDGSLLAATGIAVNVTGNINIVGDVENDGVIGDVELGTAQDLGSTISVTGNVGTTAGDVLVGTDDSGTINTDSIVIGGDIYAGISAPGATDGNVSLVGVDISVGTRNPSTGIVTGGNIDADGNVDFISDGSVDSTVDVLGDIDAGGIVTSNTAETTNFYGTVNADGGMVVRGGNYYDDVTGDLTTSGESTFHDGSSYSDGNLTNNGNLTNASAGSDTKGYGITIEDGKTFDNNGPYANEGSISFESGSILDNTTGTISNDVYRIDNPEPNVYLEYGLMDFADGAKYVTDDSTSGGIINSGVIKADVDMADGATPGVTSLVDLANDTTLLAGSEFHLWNKNNTGSEDLVDNISFKDTQAGSKVVFNAPHFGGGGDGSIDVIGATVDAGNADLIIKGSPTVAEASNVALYNGATLKTSDLSANGFVAEQNALLEVIDGLSYIVAPVATIEEDAEVRVYGGATLQYTGDTVTFNDNSTLGFDIYNPEDDSYDNKIGQLVTNGNVAIADGATLFIDDYDGDLDVNATWRVVGETLVTAEGDITGAFDNSNYHLFYGVDLDGNDVITASFNKDLSIVEMLEDMFPDEISRNKYNGGQYVDDLFYDATLDVNQTNWDLQDLTYDLATVISDFQQAYYDPDHPYYGFGYDYAWKGFGQTFGEYGAYAMNLMRDTHDAFRNTANQNFWKMQNKRIGFGLGYAQNVVSPEDAYAVVRSKRGGYDVCKSAFSVWAEGYGYWGKQRNRSNIHGYDYDSGGFNVGFDYTTGRFDFSFFGGYTKGKLKVKDLSTKFDGDMMNLGLTAAYTHESGFYGRLGLAFGYGWNDYDMHYVYDGNTYSGDYESQAYTAGLELGYIAQTSFANFIPSVGVIYTHYRHDSWDETWNGGIQDPDIRHRFDKENMNTVDIPVSLRINRIFTCGNIQIAPEARVAWVYSAKRERSRINMGYLGSDFHTTMYGVDSGRSRFVAGGGVKARFGERFDASVDYNFVGRRKYTSHNVTASFGVNF